MQRGKIVKCVSCEKDKPLYARKKCFACYTKDKRKEYNKRATEKYKDKHGDMEAFYQSFWNNQPVKECFECGCTLYSYKHWHIHHIPKKTKYPELSHNEDVCVLLCLEDHAGWHSSAISTLPEKYPKTYERFLELEEKYQIKLYN